jgi:hypothetical protein
MTGEPRRFVPSKEQLEQDCYGLGWANQRRDTIPEQRGNGKCA